MEYQALLDRLTDKIEANQASRRIAAQLPQPTDMWKSDGGVAVTKADKVRKELKKLLPVDTPKARVDQMQQAIKAVSRPDTDPSSIASRRSTKNTKATRAPRANAALEAALHSSGRRITTTTPVAELDALMALAAGLEEENDNSDDE